MLGQSHEQGSLVGKDLQVHKLQWFKRRVHTERLEPKPGRCHRLRADARLSGTAPSEDEPRSLYDTSRWLTYKPSMWKKKGSAQKALKNDYQRALKRRNSLNLTVEVGHTP